MIDDPRENSGKKNDTGKIDWMPLPLEILEPLAELMVAGEAEYGLFNCLEDFTNPDRRFWNANMRHARECQRDPLAIDPQTGCYHEAARAFNSLMRIYHCRRQAKRENAAEIERAGFWGSPVTPGPTVAAPGFGADPEELVDRGQVPAP